MGEQIVTNEQEAEMLGLEAEDARAWALRLAGAVWALAAPDREMDPRLLVPLVESFGLPPVPPSDPTGETMTLDEVRAYAKERGVPGPDVAEHDEGYDGECYCASCCEYMR